MEGIHEKHQLGVGSNHPVEDNQEEGKKLELGLESPNLDDQTLDHELVGDQEDGLVEKLQELGFQDQVGLNGEKSDGVGVKIDVEGEKNDLDGEKNDFEGEKIDGVCKKSDLDGEKNGFEGEKIDGVCEKNDLDGEKIDGVCEKNDFEGEKIDGVFEKNVFEGKMDEFEGEKIDEVCEKNDLEGKTDDYEGDVKDWGAEDEVNEVESEESEVKEGYGGEVKGVKEGGLEREGSKWSEIEEDEEESANAGFEVKRDEGFAGESEDVNGYGDGWDDKWNNDAGRIENYAGQQYYAGRNEADEGQQYYDGRNEASEGQQYYDGRNESNEGQHYYDNYDNGGYRKEQYNVEDHWSGNVEGGSVGMNDGNNGSVHYPLRPDAEDCSFYMKTGTCKFGSNCKFNHPLRRKNQAARDVFKQRDENFDGPGPTECKYHSTPGGCKYGKACRFNHSRPKPPVAPITEFNFLGLPMRVGEKECPYYMKTSSCKYGSNCRFNHPEPTVVGGGDSPSQGSIKDTTPGWSSARTLNENAPYMPVMYPPSPTAPPNGKWNEYQAPVYPTSERNLPTPPAFALRPMSIPTTDANFYAYPRQQLMVDEFPERPGQPECSFYIKTGDCKYRATCKFHHPKTRKATFTLSDQGLPLRPDQGICSHYKRYGICKYGPACKYDHPVSNSSSSESDQRQPRRYGRLGDSDGNWRREPMQQSV